MDQGFWTGQLVSFLIRTVILFFFLSSLRGLLRQVQEKNRAMRPDLVWLNLIPYFDYIWIIVTLVQVRASLRAENASFGRPSLRGDAAFSVGLVSWLLYVVAFVLVWLVEWVDPQILLYILGIMGLVMLGFWIAYWAKISSLKSELVVLATLGNSAPPQAGATAAPAAEAYSGYTSPSATADAPARDSPIGSPSGARCPFCGAECRLGAQFCSSCGRPVA